MVKLFHSHIPKCGGTWINDTLKSIPSVYSYDTILAGPDVEDHTHFGFIRNPWAWYVSWYNFNHYGSEIVETHNPPIFGVANFQSFDEFIIAFADPTDKFKKQMWNQCLHNNQDAFSTSQFRVCAAWLTSDESYLEHLYTLYFKDTIHIGKLENSRDDLIEICRKTGILTSELEEKILSNPHRQIGNKKADYREYYTDETIQLVADTHKRIITKHGYTFD